MIFSENQLSAEYISSNPTYKKIIHYILIIFHTGTPRSKDSGNVALQMTRADDIDTQ